MNRSDAHFFIGTNSSPKQAVQKTKEAKHPSSLISPSNSAAEAAASSSSETNMLLSPHDRLRHLEEPSLESSFQHYYVTPPSVPLSSRNIEAAEGDISTKKIDSGRLSDYMKRTSSLLTNFNGSDNNNDEDAANNDMTVDDNTFNGNSSMTNVSFNSSDSGYIHLQRRHLYQTEDSVGNFSNVSSVSADTTLLREESHRDGAGNGEERQRQNHPE